MSNEEGPGAESRRSFSAEEDKAGRENIPLSGLPFPLKRRLLFGVVRHDQRIVFEQVVAVDLLQAVAVVAPVALEL